MMSTDNENELDVSRTTAGNQSDDGRQHSQPLLLTNYVTNRVSTHCKLN
jgi:hypothetical protein